MTTRARFEPLVATPPKTSPTHGSGAPPAAPSALFLVVAQGPDRGLRLTIDRTPRIVGRARDASLALTDRGVSRRHLEVRLEREGVRVLACEGAQPFVVGGDKVTQAVLSPDASLIVGNTVLTVVLEAPSRDVETTDMHTVLGGLASDLVGLGALVALTDALDAALDVESHRLAISGWAPRAGAKEVRLVFAGESAGDPAIDALLGNEQALVEAPDAEGRGTLLIAPIHGSRPSWLAVRLAGGDVTDEARRLFAVAARVCGSSFARAERFARMEDENAALRAQAVGSARAFLGGSPAAVEIARLLPRLAASSATVLLLGESGTGKTFVARLLHESSARAACALRVINCAAIPEHLVESELFGHERGAFTGAVAARPGAFEAAGAGTVLLDEIGELPMTSQAKLLRVLEDRSFERIGSNRSIALAARVLAATNRDLREMVAQGKFREDLFFRISVVSLRIPALRERKGDLALLAQQILRDLSPSAGRRVTGLSPAALAALSAYPWPGNVRELRNAIEHAVVLGDTEIIAPGDLPELVRGPAKAQAAGAPATELPMRLADLEALGIEAALRATGGNRTQAAAVLGINRATLHKKLRDQDMAGGGEEKE